MKYKKLTVKSFVSMLSDEASDQLELLKQPIEPYKFSDVKQRKLGKKTIFKLTPAKSQYLDRLNNKLFSHIRINNSAIAYVEKKSYLDMFEPHRKNINFLRLDIKSFFHSINRKTLEETLSPYVTDENFFEVGSVKQSLIDALLNLVSLRVSVEYNDESLHNKDILPIGFKSSPVISNIVFRKFDIIIQELCAKNDIIYTRYADDMLFSSPVHSKYIHSDKFLNEISYILSFGGFRLNQSKTIKDKRMISINGYVVEAGENGDSGTIRISEKKTRKIYKLIYMMENNIPPKTIMNRIFKVRDRDIVYRYKKGKAKFKETFYKTQTLNRLTGYRAYIISLLKYNNKYNCIKERQVNEYQKMIIKLEKQIYRLNL
ncbi:reverse transcriptase family protein [Pseudoalteromonas sp. NJ631]|uniref:reverse transcriptase family protein n=1 Tax=Pseudoalteromonas sp. NJ631 TaxID=493915 RepID=UPI0003146CD7|nr:reverse transcriptase family protein [Pseudoalteromonas sp. NJ631]